MKPRYIVIPRPARFGLFVPVFLLLAFLGTSCHEVKDKSSGHPARKVISKDGASIFTKSDFARDLQAAMTAVDTADSLFRKRGVPDAAAGVRFAYQLNGYQPLWVEDAGVTGAAETLLQDLDSLHWDGLAPDRYRLQELRNAFNALKEGRGDLSAALSFDTSCTRSYLQASRDLLLGVVVPKKGDSLWFHTNDTVWDAPRQLANGLGKAGNYPSLNNYRSLVPTYALLRRELGRYTALAADRNLMAAKSTMGAAQSPDSVVLGIIRKELPWLEPRSGDSLDEKGQLVRGFQDFYGLNPTGKLDSGTARYLARMPDSVLPIIRVNLERLRWMPRRLEDQYVLVNIPLMELFYRKDGTDAFHMRVVVGNKSHQTPALNAPMANVVFNPSWSVPPTIMRQEIMPGISRRGDAYLARKGLRAFDTHGRPVSAASINASNYKRFKFRQPPGARNALGAIKFNLPNRWDIYLHDTPSKGDFKRRFRAKSHGCIRVERPREFAEFLLSDIDNQSGFDQLAIDSLIQKKQTRFQPLEQKIMVHIVYLTAFEDSTNQRIRFVSDVYARDAKVLLALNR